MSSNANHPNHPNWLALVTCTLVVQCGRDHDHNTHDRREQFERAIDAAIGLRRDGAAELHETETETLTALRCNVKSRVHPSHDERHGAHWG